MKTIAEIYWANAEDFNYSKTAITILQNHISAFYEQKPNVMDNGRTLVSKTVREEGTQAK